MVQDVRSRASIRQVVLRRGETRPSLARGHAPKKGWDDVRARSLLVGIDGTDEEVVEKADPSAFPPGEDHLVLGHECLAEVVEAPEGSDLDPGDLVVPLVRHGCGLCEPCARGFSASCETGRHTEHGIKGLHGFLREEWVDAPHELVRIDRTLGDSAALVEPMSVIMKAYESALEVQQRVPLFDGFAGKRALVAGTGSLGAMAAFLLLSEGMDVWALDRSSEDAASSRLMRTLGVTHVNAEETRLTDVAREVGGFSLVIEGTGSAKVAFDTACALEENGVSVLLGVPSEKPAERVEVDDFVRAMVLKNLAVVGSVNSDRVHFEAAAERLALLRGRWGATLDGVITHRFAPDAIDEAFATDDDSVIKKVVDWRST